MKIVHLSTSHTGGAGIAARRLNKVLNSNQVTSIFYALEQSDYAPGVNESIIRRPLKLRLLGWISVFISRFLSKLSFFSLFSAPSVSESWLKNAVADGSTILHIHNWFNLLSQRQLYKLVRSGVPIVFTMHDQRLMTGGCHYALTCTGLYSNCEKCPRVPRFLDARPERNVEAIILALNAKSNRVQIISPSRYLIAEAELSTSLKALKIEHIPNVLTPEFTESISREDRELTKSNYVVGVASKDPFDYIKGGDLIEQLMTNNLLHTSGINFELLADYEPENHSLFWGAIDCLLVPSRADNSPNVIHEAKSLGIPIIATSTGGISELLSMNFDIAVPLEQLSVDKLAESLFHMKSRFPNQRDREAALNNFDSYTRGSLKRLINLYESLI